MQKIITIKEYFRNINASLKKKIGLILLTSVAFTILLLIQQTSSDQIKVENDQFLIRRNEKGSKEHVEHLQVDYGEGNKDIHITIGTQGYSEEEITELLEDSVSLIEIRMLGENNSPDEVESPLNLIRFIPETGVTISWEHDNYQVMNIHGRIHHDHVPLEGSVVTLRARLSLGDAVIYHDYPVRVIPRVLSEEDQYLRSIQDLVQDAEEQSRDYEWLPLPTHIEQQPITWSKQTSRAAWIVLPFGVLLIILLIANEKNKEGEAEKERERLLLVDYPTLIHKFTLYLSAGMPVRVAWAHIGEEYLHVREMKGKRPAFEEMLNTMYAIQSGKQETECYESFGKRCKLVHYRKFSLLLSQNLRKGNKGLVHMLKQEAETAYAERKNAAKKLGEQAGTKLMLPMFIHLGIVMFIVVIPAFLSMQM